MALHNSKSMKMHFQFLYPLSNHGVVATPLSFFYCCMKTKMQRTPGFYLFYIFCAHFDEENSGGRGVCISTQIRFLKLNVTILRKCMIWSGHLQGMLELSLPFNKRNKSEIPFFRTSFGKILEFSPIFCENHTFQLFTWHGVIIT